MTPEPVDKEGKEYVEHVQGTADVEDKYRLGGEGLALKTNVSGDMEKEETAGNKRKKESMKLKVTEVSRFRLLPYLHPSHAHATHGRWMRCTFRSRAHSFGGIRAVKGSASLR